MPVIIREMDDDSATIAMVDSNLENREKLLYSEKAWAYRIKLEALNHGGIKSDMLSVEVLAEQTGESKNHCDLNYSVKAGVVA
jgi:ParB family chromosome partitioning protein